MYNINIMNITLFQAFFICLEKMATEIETVKMFKLGTMLAARKYGWEPYQDI